MEHAMIALCSRKLSVLISCAHLIIAKRGKRLTRMEHVKPVLNTLELQTTVSSASMSVALRDKAGKHQDQTRCWIKMGNAMMSAQIILINIQHKEYV